MSDQGWNTPNDPSSSPDQPGGEDNFWAKASKSSKPKKSASTRTASDDANWGTTVDPRARRRRLIRRALWISLAVVLVLALTLALLLPTIASAFVPGIVRRAAADQISGTVEVSGVSLSWSGPQVIEKLTLLDGVAPVVEARISAPVSLWSLIAGHYNLGKVELSFDAEITRDKQGLTNLQHALAPPKNAPPSVPSKDPARIPPSLIATLEISDSSITLTDESVPGQRARLRKLNAEVELEVAKTLKAALKGVVEGTTKDPFGTIELDARLNKWSDDSGLITPKKLTLDLAFKAEQLPAPALDLLASMHGRLARALGDRVDATTVIAYAPASSTAAIRVSSPHARADLLVAADASRLTLTAESPIRLSDTFVRELSTGAQDALAKSGVVELDRWPGLVLTLTKASMPIPTGPDVALGEAEIDAVLEIESAGGRIKLDPASPWKPLETRPVRVQLKAERLMRELAIKADAGALVAGQDAGTVTIDLTAANAIDTYARFTPDRLAIKGSARIRSIATALLEPLVLNTGINLATDIGPTLDIAIEGEQTAGAPAAAITIASTHLNAKARATITPENIRLTGEPGTLTWSAAGAYLARTLDPSSGWQLDPAGTATLRITKATYSTAAAKGKLGLSALASAIEADASITLNGLKLRRVGSPVPLQSEPALTADAIDLRDFSITAAIQPDRPLVLTLRSNAASGAAPFQLAADARINRPLDLLAAAPLETRILSGGVTADLRLTDTPAALAGLLAPNIGALIADLSDALGSRVNATAAIKEEAGLIALRASATLDRATLSLNADLGKGSAKVSTLSLTSTLDLASLDRLLKALSVPSGTGDLQLQGSIPITLSLNPVTIPITADLVPQPQSDQVLTATLSTPAPTNWSITPRESTATVSSALGDRVTIEPILLQITAAPATLIGEGGVVRATLTGGARSAGGSRLGDLSLTSSLALAQGRPNGPFQLNLSARAIDCALLGALIADPGLPVGIIGPSADAQLDLDARLLPDATSTRLDRLTATASITGARTRTETPLKLRLAPSGRVELESPLKIVSTPDTQWLNQTLTRAQAEPRAADPARRVGTSATANPATPARTPITFANLTPIVITLDKLNLASTLAPGQSPMPEEFDLLIETSQAALAGIDRGPLRLSAFKLRTRWTDPRRAEIALDVGSAQLGDQPATGAMKLTATLRDALSSAGVSMQSAKINADARLPLIPTALIDALAAQGGMLNELLGSSASLTMKGADYDAANKRGSAEVTATSPRASATLAGTFDPAAFRSTSPVEITITEVSPGLSAILATKQPVFGIIEKREGDQPARFTSSALSVPLAGDMSLLDGDMVIDLGEARVALSPTIAKLLKPLTATEGGAKLLRYPPLNVSARKGVLQLAKWTFPLDQFTFQTQGSIDLVKREVDLITWVPAGALTSETLGAVSQQLNTLTGKSFATIDDKVLIPLRTRGSLSNPSTTPELSGETLDEFKKLAGRLIEDQLKSKGEELIKERIPGLGGTPAGPSTPGVPTTPGIAPPKP